MLAFLMLLYVLQKLLEELRLMLLRYKLCIEDLMDLPRIPIMQLLTSDPIVIGSDTKIAQSQLFLYCTARLKSKRLSRIHLVVHGAPVNLGIV
jgi:hypothetical protein